MLGRCGSGKTTASNYLVERYGAAKFTFAQPLKELAMHLFEFTREQVYGDALAKETIDPRYGVTPRVFMQRLGAGAREYIDPNIWINGCFHRIMGEFHYGAAGYDLYTLDDVRHVNEVNAIINSTEFDGYVIKLVCTNRISKDDGTHPSESEVDLVDSSKLHAVISSALSEDSLDLKNQLDLIIPGILNEKD